MPDETTTVPTDPEAPPVEEPTPEAPPAEEPPAAPDTTIPPPPSPAADPTPPIIDPVEAQRAREVATLLAEAGNFVTPELWEAPKDTTNKQNPSALAASLGDDRVGVDQRWASPGHVMKPTVEPAALETDWSVELRRTIQSEISAALAKHGAYTLGTVPVEMTKPVPAPPVEFKKHYRCDLAPELMIQMLDMSALDRDERPQSNPLPGQYIKFRMSHLYTNDDNVIAQIEYMKARPLYSPDGENTMGGNPSIYEDDGGTVYRCTQGCDFWTASKNAFDAHMFGTHQVAVSA